MEQKMLTQSRLIVKSANLQWRVRDRYACGDEDSESTHPGDQFSLFVEAEVKLIALSGTLDEDGAVDCRNPELG